MQIDRLGSCLSRMSDGDSLRQSRKLNVTLFAQPRSLPVQYVLGDMNVHHLGVHRCFGAQSSGHVAENNARTHTHTPHARTHTHNDPHGSNDPNIDPPDFYSDTTVLNTSPCLRSPSSSRNTCASKRPFIWPCDQVVLFLAFFLPTWI